MGMQYKDPAGGTPSTIGPQLRTDYYAKKALIEKKKEMFFSQLSGTTNMPKHMGKHIRKYHYLPLLDDLNVNDMGIDAAGATIANGNLYGSSKDVGAIQGKLPMLGENGGRVNRVGFKRKTIEGTLHKFGFFTEYTQDSLDFDTDEELLMHVNREMLNGAVEITEDLLQIDLLNSAGVVRFGGSALATNQMDQTSEVDYEDFVRLSIDLDDNRTPKQTKVITGTRMTDTRTIPSCRVMYVGSEVLPLLYALKDMHGNPAFIPVEKYAAGTTVMAGEEGSIGKFRIIVVPEMMHWAGAGADAASNVTHRKSNNKFDVFPMLVVGDESFTTIGFYTDGKSLKFKIYHRKPGESAVEYSDPYGEKGLMSIKWFYGFLLERPERIGLLKTVVKM